MARLFHKVFLAVDGNMYFTQGVGMIRTAPKPLPSTVSSQKTLRLPKRNRMTLAIAMGSPQGLLLAADTRISYQDGSISDTEKVVGFAGPSGMFVIAHASHDTNAANSLIAAIRYRLETQPAVNYPEVENKIKEALLECHVTGYDVQSEIQLLIGACVRDEPYGWALYLCEPPNKISPIYDMYKAIGDGWRVSDPIYNTLFEARAPWEPHACLCQISYMMYRAKKLHPGTIGGHTDVRFLTNWQEVPHHINRVDMQQAEFYGVNLDRYFSRFASLMIGGVLRGDKDILETAEGIYSCSMLYAPIHFRCQFPDKPIVREFNT
jgi:hypothetical protein